MSDPQTLRRIDALERALAALQTRELPTSAIGAWPTDPELVGSGTAGSYTYTTTGAEYTRIGDRVFINGRCRATATAVAPVGNLSITGLPFAASSTESVIAGGIVFIQWQFNIAAGYTQVEGQILAGATSISIIRSGDNVAPAVVQGGEALAAFDLQFWGEYRVA